MRSLRIKSIVLLTIFSFDLLFPISAFALTDGPSSPEFSSFEPVSTTDMVNLVSGDMTYNLPVIKIPGAEGGGYAMSLSYHSGFNSEQEASWVGAGWTLSPGAIQKSLNGYPDEYDNAKVIRYNKNRTNWTAVSNVSIGAEFFSQDSEDANSEEGSSSTTEPEPPEPTTEPSDGEENGNSPITPPVIGVERTVRYNNYRGFSASTGFDAQFKGMGSLGFNVSNGSWTVDANINPIEVLRKLKKKNEEKQNPEAENWFKSGKWDIKKFERKKGGFGKSLSIGLRDFTAAPMAVGIGNYTGRVRNFSFNPTFTTPAVGFQAGFYGALSVQNNEPMTEMTVSGYAQAPNENNYDFHLEKSDAYQVRNTLLGIPYHSNDGYNLTGEFLGGSFRYYNNVLNSYHPHEETSTNSVLNVGYELNIGTHLGFGIDLGPSLSVTRHEGAWVNSGSFHNPNPNADIGSTIRFDNDISGNVKYTNSISDFSYNLERQNLLNVIPGNRFFKPADTEAINQIHDESSPNSRLLRSQYVEPISNGGFDITDERGNRFVYGIGVQNRNELSLLVDCQTEDHSIFNGQTVWIKNSNEASFLPDYSGTDGPVVSGDPTSSHKIAIGDQKLTSYTGTSLLTQMLSPSYLDADGISGPSEGDYGGWTHFDYKKLYGDGTGNGWYHWRMPYNGLNFSRNSMPSTTDDGANLSSGDKEVYIMESVETESHIAFFITNETVGSELAAKHPTLDLVSSDLNGSGIARLDGLGAHQNPSHHDDRKDESQTLAKLERIVLYSKKRGNRPLRTVHFEYDYSLVPNTPNNLYGNWPNNATLEHENESGRLTLTRVWFEHEGTRPVRTSPYEFHYQYFGSPGTGTVYPSSLIDLYPNVCSYGQNLEASTQNPSFDSHASNIWGYSGYQSRMQASKYRPWIFQGDRSAGSYDPAAWQLKRIVLPSGGEVHIQYEEKDYAFVQDQSAMNMCSLTNANLSSNVYFLNLEDVGIDSEQEANILIDKMRELFISRGERIAYKILIPVRPNSTGNVAPTDCAEFIEGYAKVKKIEYSANTIRIELKDSEDHSPKKAAYYHFLENFLGSAGFTCSPAYSSLDSDIQDNQLPGVLGMVDVLANMTAQFGLYPSLNSMNSHVPNPAHSYFRIPVVKKKRGGGVRVKRLLAYDPGIPSRNIEAKLHGTEYTYELESGLSSGVLANEHPSLRMENPLVKFMKRGEQTFLNRIVYGKDREESEGPVGEHLLPSPVLVHSKVISQNIANTAGSDISEERLSDSGYKVNEFLTAKDYPFGRFKGVDDQGNPKMFNSKYSELGDPNKTGTDWLSLPLGLVNFKIKRKFFSQGFRFFLNDFHGKPKSSSTYSGRYGHGSSYLVGSTVHQYFEPGEKQTLLNYENGDFKISEGSLGMVVEPVHYMDRTVEDHVSIRMEVDITVCFTAPEIRPAKAFAISSDHGEINRVMTNKVIRFPAIPKGMKTYANGAWTESENLAFDIMSGNPIVTKSSGRFDNVEYDPNQGVHDGNYYFTSIPAHWIYAGLGQKALDEMNFNELDKMTGSISSYGVLGNPLANAAPDGTLTWFDNPQNVLTASVTLYKDRWYDNSQNHVDDTELASIMESNLSNDALAELNRRILPLSSLYYKDAINDANQSGTDIQEAGHIASTIAMYDWNNANDPKWVEREHISSYDLNGRAVSSYTTLFDQTENQKLYQSVKYGYDGQLMVLSSKNSRVYNGRFYSFESSNETGASELIAHTGSRSLALDSQTQFALSGLKLNEQLHSSGGSLMLWVTGENGLRSSGSELSVRSSFDPGVTFPIRLVASVGQWQLFEIKIEDFGNDSPSDTSPPDFNLLITNESDGTVFLDDIRFEQFSASSTAYVYDPDTYRIDAILDDQNFATIFQYDMNGRLKRKALETEKGVRTVTESQFNIPSN